MYGDAQRVQDAVEQLKNERNHIANPTRVLEAIISQCSEIARIGSRPHIREIAAQLRNQAVTAYARAEANVSRIGEMLDETITTLEHEAEARVPK